MQHSSAFAAEEAVNWLDRHRYRFDRWLGCRRVGNKVEGLLNWKAIKTMWLGIAFALGHEKWKIVFCYCLTVVLAIGLDGCT